MKAKEITQKNKDLDLRRWGKNVYSKAENEGGKGEFLSGYALWMVMIETLRSYYARETTSLAQGAETPIGYAIVPVHYNIGADHLTMISQAQEVHTIEEFNMEDVQKLVEYGEDWYNALAFFYNPNDLDGAPTIVGYSIEYEKDYPQDTQPIFIRSRGGDNTYVLTKNDFTYVGYYGEVTLK